MARLRFDTSTCYQMHHVVHSGCVATQQIMLAQDAELNRIFWLGMAADQKLSESELNRFEAFMSGWVQAFQHSYLLHKSRILDSGLRHNQVQSMTWVFANPGERKYWGKWKSANATLQALLMQRRHSRLR